MYQVDVEKGKYTFINDNGIVSIKRFGEDWQENVGGKALLCLLHHVEKIELELNQYKQLSHEAVEDEIADSGKILFHDAFKDTVRPGAMQEYALVHGKEIHENGTHVLVTYDAEVEEDCLFLNLDFDDDHRTPRFYVTRILDNDLESHDTIHEAMADFASRLVNQNQLDEAFVIRELGAGFFVQDSN